MPYIELKTNKQLSKDKKLDILKDLTALISKDLGKPDQYIMATCRDDLDMMFGGSTDPLVFFDLSSIRLPVSQTADLSQSLAAFVKENLGISSDRVFINFRDVEPHMWGFKSGTF